MSQVTIENPLYHQEKTVDGQGRLYIGQAHAGERVRVTVERVGDDDE